MTNTLSLMPAARQSSDLNPALYSDHMLSELLALHEQMIVQLRREHLGVVVIANFLTDTIDQHEKAAALLRTQFESHATDAAHEDMIIITPNDSSEAKELPGPGFTPDLRTPFYASA